VSIVYKSVETVNKKPNNTLKTTIVEFKSSENFIEFTMPLSNT
jgi:hypothetical protein